MAMSKKKKILLAVGATALVGTGVGVAIVIKHKNDQIAECVDKIANLEKVCEYEKVCVTMGACTVIKDTFGEEGLEKFVDAVKNLTNATPQ